MEQNFFKQKIFYNIDRVKPEVDEWLNELAKEELILNSIINIDGMHVINDMLLVIVKIRYEIA